MILFKIKTKIRRFISRRLEIHRPSSYPYLSGDGFRAIANYVYDQFLDFDPKNVMYGDIVFVRNNQLRDYFSDIHPNIDHPYVLLSGNADKPAGSDFDKYIDEKILHWYAGNVDFKNPKVSLLPIGIQNFVSGEDRNFTDSINTEFTERKNRILYGFTVDLSTERRIALDHLSKSKLSDKVSLPRSQYYSELKKYKYVASPSGGGIDCHRTWEALYFGTIPIIRNGVYAEYLLKLDLPILVINDWSDIENLTPEFLEDFYEKNKNRFVNPKMYLDNWYKEFSSYKTKK